MDVLRGILAVVSMLLALFWITGTFCVKEFSGKITFAALGIINFLCGVVLITWGSC